MMNLNDWLDKYFKETNIDPKILEEALHEISQEKVAVYAISGDPPTWGHADIMMRAAKKFSKLYWVIGKNSEKKYMFDNNDKIDMMDIYVKHYKLNNVIIDEVDGSVAKYALQKDASFLIRGLRSSSDYQMEYEFSIGNRGINKNLETICMFTKPHYATISSTIVRELASLGERISQYVHPKVEKLIKEKVNK